MKRPIILFLFVGIFFLPTALWASYNVHHNERPMSDASKTIDLNGKFKSGDLRSGTDPIIVEQDGKTLYISFQTDVSILNITITGVQGVIFISSVDTSSPSTLTIPLNSYSSGNYTITFTNQYGTMQGDFEL